MPDDTCYHCARTAVKLCDGIRAFPSGGEGNIDTDHLGKTVTCDRSLCREHTTVIGRRCGRNGSDTIDYCPRCADNWTSNHEPPLVESELL